MLLRKKSEAAKVKRLLQLQCANLTTPGDIQDKSRKVLNLPRNFDKDDLKHVYIEKAKQCHPDLHPDKQGEFMELTKHYELLRQELESNSRSRGQSCDPPDPSLWDWDYRIDDTLNSDVWLQQVIIAHRKTLKLREIRATNRWIGIINLIIFAFLNTLYLIKFDLLPHEKLCSYLEEIRHIF